MNTRYATSGDIPELVRIINLAYRVEDFFIDGDRTNTNDVQSRLAAPGACFIVIDAPGNKSLAGAVWVETHGDKGHFAVLSVDPAFQGTGLARLMIDAVEDHCRKAGCTSLVLEVVDLREELPAFYSKFGFEPAGTAPFPSTEKLTRPAHLMLMTKSLAEPGATNLR
jgi:ribosomal protein S18 acetylase RimI-like enzyme